MKQIKITLIALTITMIGLCLSILISYWRNKHVIESQNTEKIVKRIQSNYNSSIYTEFPQEDVIASIDKYPNKITVASPNSALNYQYWHNPYHYPLMKVWFRSPDWTWEQLCGRSGELTICSVCGKHFEFDCQLLN